MKDKILLLKTITLKKLFNLLLLRLSYVISLIFKQPVLWGKPYGLAIEPTNCCNLHCPECPSGMRQLTRTKGYLNLDDYNRIIEQIYPWLITLILYFQGEPLLHPDIFSMIKGAKNLNLYTLLSTNGHFLTESTIKQLVNSGLQKLIISLDGTNAETYKIYRKGGNYNQVMDGIKNLVALKQFQGQQLPLIELQFLVFKHNEHQIADFLALKEQLQVDCITLKSAQVYDFEKGEDLITSNEEYSRYKLVNGRWQIKNKLRNRCWRVWSRAVITHDLFVLPCCFDKDATFKFNNLKQDNLLHIWRNKARNNFLKTILSQRKKIVMCCNCTEGIRV